MTTITTTTGTLYEYTDAQGNTLILTSEQANAIDAMLVADGMDPTTFDSELTAVTATTTTFSSSSGNADSGGGGSTTCLGSLSGDGSCDMNPVQQEITAFYANQSNVGSEKCSIPDASGCVKCQITFNDGTSPMYPTFGCPPSSYSHCQSPGN
jgi:hypothetical protein